MSQFSRTAPTPARGKTSEELLTEFLGPDGDPNDFWQKVKTNLQAGRIRMVFVADAIPPELRRVVEFLDEEMDPAEVLAIEAKQYVGTGVKTLVARVVGQTETARQKKSLASGSTEKWDEAAFMEDLRDAKGEAAAHFAKEILDWITPQASYVWWGRGVNEGGIVPVIQHGKAKYHLFRMASKGKFVFRFNWLMATPFFADETKRKELLARINAIPGVRFGEDVLKRGPKIPFDLLLSSDAQEKLKAAISFIVDAIGAGPTTEDA